MNSEATKTHPMPSFWSLFAEGEQKNPPSGSISVSEVVDGKEEINSNVYYLRNLKFLADLAQLRNRFTDLLPKPCVSAFPLWAEVRAKSPGMTLGRHERRGRQAGGH